MLEEHPFLVAGSTVKIVNLKAAAQYNGKMGRIAGFQKDNGRCNVELGNNKNKNLGIKPVNLILYCAHCQQNPTPEDASSFSCRSCNSAYCSQACFQQCMREDRTSLLPHDATCIPLTLPEVPKAPNMHNANFENEMVKSQHYINRAEKAGKKGRKMEQIKMLEAMQGVGGQDGQPSPYLMLFGAYKYLAVNKNTIKENDAEKEEWMDKAFDALESTATIMNDPDIIEEGKKQMPVEGCTGSMQNMLQIMLSDGTSFLDDYVVGLPEWNLKRVAKVLEIFASDLILEATPLESFNNHGRAFMFMLLGNVYRKLSANKRIGAKCSELAMNWLERSDQHLFDTEKEHQFDSLILRCEVLLAHHTLFVKPTGSDRDDRMREVVQEARRIKELADAAPQEQRDESLYKAQVLLGTMMYNQNQLMRKWNGTDPSQESMREIIELMSEGGERAQQLGDHNRAMRAQQILNHFS